MGFDGKHSDVTGKVIESFYQVYNNLGFGFYEKVYENAMVIEMGRKGLRVIQQVPIKVYYAGKVIGEYVADMVVNEVVIVELKAVEQLCQEHEAQLLNYLKATEMEVGLLLNFGPQAQFIRKVFDNERKGSLEWVKEGTRMERIRRVNTDLKK